MLFKARAPWCTYNFLKIKIGIENCSVGAAYKKIRRKRRVRTLEKTEEHKESLQINAVVVVGGGTHSGGVSSDRLKQK